jgi:hypothetical protein
MPTIPEEVQDVVRGVNVTIVDLIGALLPGLVWFILFATIVLLATQPELGPTISPFQTSKDILQYGSKHGRASYAAVVLVAILLGWVIKAAGLDWADGICAWCIWLLRQPSLWRARKRQRFAPAGAEPSAHPIADLLFPYNRIVENKHGEVMVRVKELAAYHLGQGWEKAPGRQPFDSCKLVLQQLNPLCRDTAERAEAQVSLLGSLFLASLFSLASAVFAYLLKRSGWEWIGASAAAAAFLGYSFRKDRLAEVEKIYIMALLVQHGVEKEPKGARASAAGPSSLHSD